LHLDVFDQPAKELQKNVLLSSLSVFGITTLDTLGILDILGTSSILSTVSYL
jgi:hypothetical protein